jgi:nucleotide-binding universal stress UspA family protein
LGRISRWSTASVSWRTPATGPHLDIETFLTETGHGGRAAGLDIDAVVEDGPAANVIVRVADRQHADLIVVGSRGLGQTPRLLGSVSEAVLSHARIPVLIVPAP